MAHVLIIDDEESICWGLARLARKLGHTSTVSASAEDGLQAAETRRPQAVFLDVRLPGLDGLSAMAKFRAVCPDVPLVIMTAYGDLSTAVQAVRNGAFEYLVKPFELDAATHILSRAFDRSATSVKRLSAEAATEKLSEEEMIGSSPAMQEVFRQIALAAPSEACVHLNGESGVGKELVARAIHRHSARGTGPFVPVHIASLNPSLAESELFGHMQGAFTGADFQRIGLLQQAAGGTIFLDEVADIPSSVQVKLLRALELGEVYPVGSPEPVKTDFRLISAANVDLRQRVAAGSFRHDLYYRLVTLEIPLPALRDRRDDIRALTRHFLQRLAAKNRLSEPAVSEAFWKELQFRPWHGNVRELRNALERALVLSTGGPLQPEHLPQSAPAASTSQPANDQLPGLIRHWAARQLQRDPDSTNLHEQLLEIVEPPLFETALSQYQGQVAAAARRLGLHRTTLRKKLDALGIDPV